jgi:branched-chain amino acid transport system ATP-binding protein
MQFGGLAAVSDFSIAVEDGEIAGLIGPNGAGKTTAFNVITVVYAPAKGDVLLDGKSVAGKPPYLIAKAGIARTFQNIRLFNEMTVLENILAACTLREQPGLFESILHLPGYLKKERKALDFSRELMPPLSAKLDRLMRLVKAYERRVAEQQAEISRLKAELEEAGRSL